MTTIEIQEFIGSGLLLMNQISSIAIFINSTLFYLFVFGRENSRVFGRPIWEQYMLRIGILVLGSGSLLNVLSTICPPMNEIVVNLGLALLLSWAARFHYYSFVKK